MTPEIPNELDDVPENLSSQNVNYMTLSETSMSQAINTARLFSTKQTFVAKAFVYTNAHGAERAVLRVVIDERATTYDDLRNRLEYGDSAITKAVSKLKADHLIKTSGNPSVIKPSSDEMASIITYALDATEELD